MTAQEPSSRSTCQHEFRYARRTQANGVEVLGKQCTRCGSWQGCKKHVVLAAAGPGPLPEYDHLIGERFYEKCSAAWASVRAAKEREAEQEREAWWSWYNDYLQSTAWRAKRAAVVSRDGGVCRGCGAKHATQVHHLTYTNVGHEFLFELVAVCDDCHERLHLKSRPA